MGGKVFMKRYIVIRILQAIVTVIGVSILTFLLTHLSGDPVQLMAPQDATAEFGREILDAAAEVAVKEVHHRLAHPDLYLAWGKCQVEIWTHKIQGLTESDFFMAAKADRAYQGHG